MVRIYATQIDPDYQNPWRLKTAQQASGSGTVIANNKIITNAHVVSNSRFIQVRSFGEARKFKAQVVAVSHEADLALLAVDDESFFDDIAPLQLGDLPKLQDSVLVYGFPKGGDNLSITKGVVSRIEHSEYAHSSQNLLAVQIDASINSGNSGGAVINDGKIVGVVMQSIADAQNTNYAVPVSIIQHFLTDMEDGNYDGFPTLSIQLQPLENKNLKLKYGLPVDQTGVLVAKIVDDSTTGGLLKLYDILLGIDGHPIADDSTIEFRANERTSVDYYTQLHQVGEVCELDIFRDGKKHHIQVEMTVGRYFQVPREQYDVLPAYYIFGGFVFSPLTTNYLHSWGADWRVNAPVELRYLHEKAYWQKDKKELVNLVSVLPHDINVGYHRIADLVIAEVDGVPLKGLDHMTSLVENSASEDSLVEIKTKGGVIILVNKDEAEKTHESILRRYGALGNRGGE